LPEFEHSVDFYNQKDKVAIEVEKAEIKRVVHDILKIINATKTIRKSQRLILYKAQLFNIWYGRQSN
jgi:hypothetical protein